MQNEFEEKRTPFSGKKRVVVVEVVVAIVEN